MTAVNREPIGLLFSDIYSFCAKLNAFYNVVLNMHLLVQISFYTRFTPQCASNIFENPQGTSEVLDPNLLFSLGTMGCFDSDNSSIRQRSL